MTQYVQAMTDRALLPRRVRLALQNAIVELIEREGSQVAAARALGVSQPAVQKAAQRAEVGPTIERKVREHFGLRDEAELVARFGAAAEEPLAALDVDSSDPLPERAHAIALAQHAGADPRAISWARDLDADGQPVVWWLTRIIARHGELAALPPQTQGAARGATAAARAADVAARVAGTLSRRPPSKR